MENIFKKWYFWAIIIVILIRLFSLRGCREPDVTRSDIEHSIVSTLTRRGGGSRDDVIIESIIERLCIDLEPLDFVCIMGEEDCLENCFDEELTPCEDNFYDCVDVCDEDFPITDEIEECWDGCLDVYNTCEDVCESDDELDDDELDDCYNDCGSELWNCEDDCDFEYVECSGDCIDEFMSPCLSSAADCMYVCLEDCIIEEEVYEWDGSEVTDIGGFYETGFPQFDGQFNMMCEWIFMGDIVSTENKYGCTNMWFFGNWIASYLQSIDSMQVVCETVGGEFVINDGEVSCNI